jgi:hypothetical protein
MTNGKYLTRRQLFGQTTYGIGAAALASLLGPDGMPASASDRSALGAPHFPGKAKRVIYLFQSGGPSQMETFDYKPSLKKLHGTELPDSIRQGQRVTAMTVEQSSFPCVSSSFKLSRHGACGRWVSELLPHIAGISDEISVIKSVNTEAINHDPAITFINTGSQQPGKASLGSWLSYGIGSECQDLPSYVVLISQGTGRGGQPLFSRLWSSGFLPSKHQGVKFRSASDPVLYLSNPPGLDTSGRRATLDALAQLNELKAATVADPEIETRIAQYEMAYRMQMSVPGLMDLSNETDDTFNRYGPNARTPGTYAANCVLARRLAERGVRFIQLFHRGWDHHGDLPSALRLQCDDVDQPSAALVNDLKERGMLDETLIVWGGEFGRTVYCQGNLTQDNYGRDHHGRCFSMWFAGGGIRGGVEHGETDDYCYNIVRDPVHIRDVNATILHCLGIDHRRLTFRFRGLDQRLTGVEEAHVVRPILA